MSNLQEEIASPPEFIIQPCNLGSTVFSPGQRVRFSVDREPRPGDTVGVFLDNSFHHENDRIRIDHPENVLIRKLLYRTRRKVALKSVIGPEKETIPADCVKAIYPVCRVSFDNGGTLCVVNFK